MQNLVQGQCSFRCHGDCFYLYYVCVWSGSLILERLDMCICMILCMFRVEGASADKHCALLN